MTTAIRTLSALDQVTQHSNYGGYYIVKNGEGLYFVGEPFLNHRGEMRRRNVGGWVEHKQAREYCQQNCMNWMALHDRIDNA
jgi:hypothetical protein